MVKKLVKFLMILTVGSCLGACTRNSDLKEQDVIQEHVQDEVVIEKINRKDNKIAVVNGKILSNLEQVGQDDSYYCNLEENLRGELASEYEVLLCKDPVYDIVYYVNCGRDYYIYAVRGGTSEVVVEIPAKSLYCRNGELYFMAESYGLFEFDGIANGTILKYNPVDGSVSVVVKESASRMIVYPDGICYMVIGETKKYDNGTNTTEEKRYFFSFAEQETVEQLDSCVLMERYRGSYFVNMYEKLDESSEIVQYYRSLGVTEDISTLVGTKLQSVDGNKEATLQNMKTSMMSKHWIYKDELYYIEHQKEECEDNHIDERDVLMAYNLETDEYREVVRLNRNVNSLADFFIVNDVVYFGDFLRVSLADGEQSMAQVAIGEDAEAVYIIDAFYSDGDGGLYCLCNGKIWVMEESRNMESDMYEQEECDGLFVTWNAYRYILKPLGGNEN